MFVLLTSRRYGETRKLNDMNKAFLNLLTQRVVESVHHHSGGGFFHRFLRFDNGVILAIHFATETMEVSHKAYESVEQYIDTGFGMEYDHPDYERRSMSFDRFFCCFFINGFANA